MNRHNLNLLTIHVAVLFFGLAGVLGKMLAVQPRMVVFSRAALGALGLLLIIVVVGRFRRPNKIELVFLSGSGFILALHWWTFFEAIKRSSVAIALLAFSSFPVFVT